MIFPRLLQYLTCSSAAFALSACGMFGSKEPSTAPAGASAGSQQFDLYSRTWKPTPKIVRPPPSEPNATLAEQEAAAKRENSTLNKAGRAMSNTVGAVGRVVKKPLDWLPIGKKDAPNGEEKAAVQ